jgi:acetyl-CoA acetyltransferase
LTRTDRTPVIVGVALSDYPKAPHLTSHGHHAQALQRVLQDSGVALRDIDGYMSVGTGGLMVDDIATMAEYFQIRHRWAEGSQIGGGAYQGFVDHASTVIASGLCDTVLMTYGSDLRSNKRRSLAPKNADGAGLVESPRCYENPYGHTILGNYAFAAARHMYEFGTTPEQLAEIAVSTRLHAARNPNALYRDPITIDDVVTAPRVADPLGKLDSCVVTDGGAAIIMTTAERARDLRQPPIHVLGSATAQTHWNISQMPDFTTTAAAICGPRAFERAGLRPEDIDTAQIYDSFTITVLLLLEGLGFCGRGEGGAFVADGKLRPGGSLPTNTDGGGLSSCHPGMRGVFTLAEAVLQLRGQAGDRQVPDAGLAVVCGSGGILSYISTLILGRDPR